LRDELLDEFQSLFHLLLARSQELSQMFLKLLAKRQLLVAADLRVLYSFIHTRQVSPPSTRTRDLLGLTASINQLLRITGLIAAVIFRDVKFQLSRFSVNSPFIFICHLFFIYIFKIQSKQPISLYYH